MKDSFKARLRVPTSDQYAFLEIDAEGTPDELVGAYRTFMGLVAAGSGLSNGEWNTVFDGYRHGKSCTPEQHEKMSDRQKWVIHEIDKSNERNRRLQIIKEAKEKQS